MLVDELRKMLALCGFEIRQWASNDPAVVEHLPKEARSNSTDLWLSHNKTEVAESTLGLKWDCQTP